MGLTASELIDRIAPDEVAYQQRPDFYLGFIRKSRKRVCLDLAWCGTGKLVELTVNKYGLVCSRTLLANGKTWYGYTLSPFGDDVPFGVECEAGRLMLKAFLP